VVRVHAEKEGSLKEWRETSTRMRSGGGLCLNATTNTNTNRNTNGDKITGEAVPLKIEMPDRES
jgi:hypothetical protein